MPRLLAALALLAATSLPAPPAPAEECTAAVVGPGAAEGGRPLLWKNRDTDTLSNKVVFVKESPHSYLALVDADEPTGRWAYAGVNDQGLAVMNTVAYNLPGAAAGEMEDLEGLLLAEALRTCRTVEDVEAFLGANRGRSLGARTNIGALDARGRAVVFETHNRGFEQLDAAAAPEGYLVVTNWSRSGKPGQGAGYPRFERATALLRDLAREPLSAHALLRHVARDTGHALLDQPALDQLRALPPTPPRFVHSRHTIDRWDTSAAVVVVGRHPADPASQPVLWVVPGEPVTAVAVPVFVGAGTTPPALREGREAPLWAESARLKALARPFPEHEKREYLDLTRLDNAAGTGWLPGLLEAERRIADRTRAFLARPRSAAELARFQEEMADLALAAMRAVR